MSEETKSQGPADPMEIWEQWYGAALKGWSRTNSDRSKPPQPDPLNFYHTWLKGVADVQEQLKTGAGDPQEMWKQWFEAATEAWRKAAEIGGDPLGLTTQWVEMMEEARARFLTGVKLPADPFTFFKQWYDATSETWSTVIGDVIGTEQFMEMSSEFLKSYVSFYSTMRRTNEEYFRNLQLPTRSDIARIAELVVNLEDKVDGLDSTLENFEDSIGSEPGHFPIVLQKLESIEGIEQRVGGLENRLDRVESKLDALLAALAKLDSNTPAQTAKPDGTARSRARKPKAELQQVSDTEA